MPATFPFDPTGLLPTNKIVNEPVSITVANAIGGYLIVPNATPFYAQGFSLVNSSGTTLTEGVDYLLTHHWAQGSNATGLDVYGSITLLHGYPTGNYKLNYQTIGGEYVSAPITVLTNGITATDGEYATIDWSTAPAAFPATAHTEPLSGLTGMSQIYEAILGISTALRSAPAGVHYNDVAEINNTYALGVIDPMLETIVSISKNTESMGKLILNAISTLQAMLDYSAISNGLQHYAIPLPGGFQLKIGRIVFQSGKEPKGITFAGLPFANQCVYADCKLSYVLGTDGIGSTLPLQVMGDTVEISAPNTSGMFIKVHYDSEIELSRSGVTWAATNVLPGTFPEGACVIMPNNTVIAAGGGYGASVSNVVYFGTYNPVTDTMGAWTTSTTTLPYSARGLDLSLLSDGRIMLSGGWTGAAAVNSVYFGTVDPVAKTITWVAGTNLPGVTYDHCVLMEANDTFIILGGKNTTVATNAIWFGTISAPTTSPNTITWNISPSTVPADIAEAQIDLLADGRIIITGGIFYGGAGGVTLPSVYLGTVNLGTFSVVWCNGTPLPVALQQHRMAVLTDGRLICQGGSDVNGNISIGGSYIGVVQNNFITWVSVDAPATPITLGVLKVFPNGNVFAAGGLDLYSVSTSQAFIGTIKYNPPASTNLQLNYIAIGI